MNSITQDMKFRYSLINLSLKYGVSRAGRKYNKTRSYIYFWRNCFDATIESLACKSRRPLSPSRKRGQENQRENGLNRRKTVKSKLKLRNSRESSKRSQREQASQYRNEDEDGCRRPQCRQKKRLGLHREWKSGEGKSVHI